MSDSFWFWHPAVLKAQRAEDAAFHRLAETLDRPADDPIWQSEKFWRLQWPKLVDRHGEAVENTIRVSRRVRGDPPLEDEPWYREWTAFVESFSRESA